MMMMEPGAGGIPIGVDADPNAALRFEDLTIDDELPLIERVMRYCRSGIALQRLVHVKMLAEAADSVGSTKTIRMLIPMLPPLVIDQESIIRQHLATQLLPLSLACMFGDDKLKNDDDSRDRQYSEDGYKVVTNTIITHLNTLISDADMDVRKAASDSLATLALHVKPDDVAPMILPIPLRLAHEGDKSNTTKKAPETDDGFSEDLRITAANLLGDVSSLVSSQITPPLVGEYVIPKILVLCQDKNFRVRRAAVQALPRVLSGCSGDDAERLILPAFLQLSKDDMYRVRKSVGECLVDMSRSLMLLASRRPGNSPDGNQDSSGKPANRTNVLSKTELREKMMDLRRSTLVPIATRLLADSNKLVRHGMMQFLGPFIASFYPLEGLGGEDGTDKDAQPGVMGLLDEAFGQSNDGGSVGGTMGAQFFPHAHGMVSRLNPSSTGALITSAQGENKKQEERTPTEEEKLLGKLPAFLQTYMYDAASLNYILHHRQANPPVTQDVKLVKAALLPHFVALATINSGDENTDAEMRVYCAYSLPAVVLLLGREGWENLLRDCFLALMTGVDGSKKMAGGEAEGVQVPLPVKRCLASSFHTVSHILGPEIVATPPPDGKMCLLNVFESHFLTEPDDTVRINVIRNLPAFLCILSPSTRSKYLPTLNKIIMGDSMLGATRRKSVASSMLLNWRQRDMVARILPNILILFHPVQVRGFLWPIVQMLLNDSVSLVRENVEFSIPVLLRCYAPERFGSGSDEEDANESETPGSGTEAREWSEEACTEVISYLKATLLESRKDSGTNGANGRTCGAFSRRQEYCRICASVALALQLGGCSLKKDEKRQNGKKSASETGKPLPQHPFQNFTRAEYNLIHALLLRYLLPSALSMKDDRVANVRFTLAKCLRMLPRDIRTGAEVNSILHTLEEEAETWEVSATYPEDLVANSDAFAGGEEEDAKPVPAEGGPAANVGAATADSEAAEPVDSNSPSQNATDSTENESEEGKEKTKTKKGTSTNTPATTEKENKKSSKASANKKEIKKDVRREKNDESSSLASI